MITAEQIPEAVAHAAESARSKDATWKEVVAAALNAWENMIVGNSLFDGRPMAFLPLNEPRDDNA